MSDEFDDTVDALLERIEREHDVRVVAARDVGSRAWNLADPTSDRDVGVVFAQRPHQYALLDGYESSVRVRSGEADCQGWNVKRFAELLADSNPTAFEFLHSPLRYRTFRPLERLETDVGDSFSPIALYHHYRSLAERQYRTYLQGRLFEDGELAYLVLEERDDEYLVRPVDASGHDARPDGIANDEPRNDELRTVPRDAYEEGRTDRTVKRHLYVSRGVLYARYVRESNRFPTLDFPRFLAEEADRDAFDPAFVETTRELVERKRRGEGDAVVGRLFDPDDVSLPEIDPSAHAGRRVDRARLNDFVRETLDVTFA
ncbi:DNA polymerase beta superfamily protein [Halovivax sp.]|uniref:DNA polymerase beta superfamily protein n=1 Tax=Halovivax sp. TaxID=1935978 RepID=UPI0025BE8E68|nr:nucleotidyltransferase domain-containing protein [Halovivax sp.]